MVAAKIDVAQGSEKIDALRELAREQELPFFELSSVTGQGVDALKYAMAAVLFGSPGDRHAP